MANTAVLIQDELGLRVPNVPSVPVVAGNGVTFTAVQGADAVLYFSPDTAAILSPPPESPVSLPAGAAVDFTFLAPEAASYGVIVQAPGDTFPSDFDFGGATEPPSLVIQPGSGLSFPGPTTPIKTGRI